MFKERAITYENVCRYLSNDSKGTELYLAYWCVYSMTHRRSNCCCGYYFRETLSYDMDYSTAISKIKEHDEIPDKAKKLIIKALKREREYLLKFGLIC